MSAYDRFLSIVIYGESKVGKTWLASSAPKPILFLDSEAGGMRFVPGRKIKWDPISEDPPEYDESWDICRVVVNNSKVLDSARDWIASGRVPFRSIVVDSLTEFQSRYKRELNPSRNGAFKNLGYTGWGQMLVKLEDLIVQLRDIGDRYEHIECVVFVLGSDLRAGQRLPLLDGKMQNIISYKVDATGYLTVEYDEDGNQIRLLQLTPTDTVHAGNRLGGLIEDYIWSPNLTKMVDTLEEGIHAMQEGEK